MLPNMLSDIHASTQDYQLDLLYLLQVGTIRYMAPEVLEGAITFNRESILRIDVYALGLVIWEIISRCSFGGTVSDYKQPFEEEVGLRPKVHQMTEVVVHSRKRPRFPNGWDCMQVS
jgi:serine/threonine protein kinase